MTATYRTRGSLAHPVSDLKAAREFLRREELGMEVHIYPAEAKPNVHSVTWDLTSESEWEVTLVADCQLPPEQLALLSEWISGQNSDGLGEGFEQQPFAEHDLEEEEYEDDDGDYLDARIIMSSFDWQTNPCTLTAVR